MGVIYSIMNPKGKLYVGKTYNLRKRINSHKCCTRKGSTVILHNSIRKYGWDNHLLSVIEEVPDEFINEREIFWIATLKTYCYENKMGLNMTMAEMGNVVHGCTILKGERKQANILLKIHHLKEGDIRRNLRL